MFDIKVTMSGDVNSPTISWRGCMRYFVVNFLDFVFDSRFYQQNIIYRLLNQPDINSRKTV